MALVGTLTGLSACSVVLTPTVSALPGGGSQAMARNRTAFADNHVLLPVDTKAKPITFKTTRGATGLPAAVDLRAKMSPIRDQGPLLSCTAFAIAGLAEYRARLKGDTTTLSPGFLYALEVAASGGMDGDLRPPLGTGMSILHTTGIAPETLHPYISPFDQQTPFKVRAYIGTQPSKAAVAAAAAYRTAGTTELGDYNEFRQAIAAGKPVTFSVAIYPGFRTQTTWTTGVVPVPDTANERPVGGHAVLAVGYDDAKQWLIFKNSYGADWGDHGYGYIPYAYIRRGLLNSAWTAD